MTNIVLIIVLTILCLTYVECFCKFPEYFHVCGKLREPTCTNPRKPEHLDWEECLINGPGCRCHDGYVRNMQTKTCMSKEKCLGITLANAVQKTFNAVFSSLLKSHDCK